MIRRRRGAGRQTGWSYHPVFLFGRRRDHVVALRRGVSPARAAGTFDKRPAAAPTGGTMADESYPKELSYYKEHDWVRVDGEDAVFGITWFAQDALGEIVYAELPAVGDTVTGGGTYGELESVKAVSEVYAPLSGEVVEVNEALQDEPQRVNEDCYGEGWLIRVRMTAPGELGELMDADEYKAFLDEA
jgi:glycine cleavage system H protein